MFSASLVQLGKTRNYISEQWKKNPWALFWYMN